MQQGNWQLGLGAFEHSVLHVGVDSGTNVSRNSLSSVVSSLSFGTKMAGKTEKESLLFQSNRDRQPLQNNFPHCCLLQTLGLYLLQANSNCHRHYTGSRVLHVDIISSVDVEGSETDSKSSSLLFSCKFLCVIFVKPKLLSFGTFKAAAWSFASRCLLHRFLFGIFHSSLVIVILGYSLHLMQKIISYCILKTSKSSLCLHKKREFKTFSVSTSVSTIHLKFL